MIGVWVHDGSNAVAGWGRGGSDVVGRFGFMVTMRSLTTKLREKLEILRFCEARAKRSSN